MARLIIEGYGEHEVEPGTRLVRAIQVAGVDILHRCGGFARCTTCRVEFLAGEPERMTVAEHDKLVDTAAIRLETHLRALDSYERERVQQGVIFALSAFGIVVLSILLKAML